MVRNIIGLSFASACLIMQGCVVDNSSTSGSVSQGTPSQDSTTVSTLDPAYQLNRDASTQARLAHPAVAAKEPEHRAAAPIAATAWSPSQAPKGSQSPHGFDIQSALLKRSSGALTKASAKASAGQSILHDTSFFRNDDSAKGYVQWLRTYDFTDSTGTGSGKDSIVYKWPYSPTTASVLAHVSVRTYAGGKVITAMVMDDDGDGILNQAPTAKVVKLRKQWITVLGDTTWKTLTFTTHGQSTFYDSLGIGAPTSWTDSIFVKGKNVWWQKTRDGDNDGFVLTHAAGAKIQVLRDSYQDQGDGNSRFDFEVLGAGADGDYLTQADNEHYPYRSVIVGADGKDKVNTKYGDGDGDGFFWNPVAGAANRAWVKNEYPAGDSIVSRTDSLVETLPATGNLAYAKIAFFAATLKFKDGTVTVANTKAASGSFSGTDSITVWEHTSYADYIPKGPNDPLSDYDSILRVSFIVPHDLGTPSDDEITRWYTQIFYKSGRALVSSTDVFTPDVPVSPGQAAAAGTSIHEDILKPLTGQSVVRDDVYRTIDPAKGLNDWREVRYFENGDSSVATGASESAGVGTYARNLGLNVKSTGHADAATGDFQDTLTVLDAAGKPSFTEYCEGTLKGELGLGEFDRTMVRQGVSTKSHFTVTKLGTSGIHLERVTGADTSRMDIVGDTAVTTVTMGGVERKCSWFPEGAGLYKVQETETVTTGNAPKATGDFHFGEDGSGSGAYIPYVKGKAQPEAKVFFRADGAIFLDGVKISK